jgi:4-amino-4-deoxy-L-arabinose transferase-like glycosyltransferase
MDAGYNSGVFPSEFGRKDPSGVLDRFRTLSGKAHFVFFAVILAFGAFVRLWNLGSVPPGLNQDEAGIGVDAYSLYHYGVDHNGVSFPVNFVAWGSGQDGLYTYFVLPFTGGGLSPWVERLPMALSGVITLALVYLVGRKCIGPRFGLLAMFLMAVSPWHIMMSRFGLNDNILVFTFALGAALLALSRADNSWYPAAMAVFGLSLYAYGTAYVAVPLFVLMAAVYLYRNRLLTPRKWILGWGIFGLIALPIVLFVAVNTFGWDTIRLGFLSIPRLPVKARFQNMAVLFSPDIPASLAANAKYLWDVLWNQTDGLIWNALARYGYGYPGAVLFAAVGLGVYLFWLRPRAQGPVWLPILWLAAALSLGLAMESNINRLNILFPAILLLMAAVLEFLFEKFRPAGWAAVCGYSVLAFLFVRVYLGGRYAEMASDAFLTGFVPALQTVNRYPDSSVCMTDRAGVSYVYMLWVEPQDPWTYLPTLEYFDPNAQFRVAKTFGRYTFGMQNCALTENTIYLLAGESPPEAGVEYRSETYGGFQVYIPAGLTPKRED